MKRFFAFLVTICLIMAIAPTTTFAATKVANITEGFYYIQHVDGKLFLEIDPEDISKDEEPLRLWSKIDARQSQVFYLSSTKDGWVITCYPSGKVIDVKESSKSNKAQIVQNDDVSQKSARWTITQYTDGTVSFKNKNSSKYMVVNGNQYMYGTKLMQYTYNEDRYNLYRLDEKDVLSAKWVRELDKSEITWSKDGGPNTNILNLTGWDYPNRPNYYPTPGNRYFMGVEYFTPEEVKQIAEIRQKTPEFWQDLKKAVNGESTDEEVEKLVKTLGFENIPYVDHARGILEVVWNNRNNTSWNDFLKKVYSKKDGTYKGLIVYTYEIVTERGETWYIDKNTMGWTRNIETVKQYEYDSWTGTNFDEVQYNPKETGKWHYIFK